MYSTKQVIVVRKDLNMRTGKLAAQVAHASMSFLTRNILIGTDIDANERPWIAQSHLGNNRDEVKRWLKNSFRKIVVYVNSEAELDTVYDLALDLQLVTHMVIDNGATEFNGVPTKTCIAIGPHYDYLFKHVTDDLPLL